MVRAVAHAARNYVIEVAHGQHRCIKATAATTLEYFSRHATPNYHGMYHAVADLRAVREWIEEAYLTVNDAA
jgi:hypothetical protein